MLADSSVETSSDTVGTAADTTEQGIDSTGVEPDSVADTLAGAGIDAAPADSSDSTQLLPAGSEPATDTTIDRHEDSAAPPAGVEDSPPRPGGAVREAVKSETLRRTLRTLLGWLNWMLGHLVHFFVIIFSAMIVWATVMFYLRKRRQERFMTNTRLSLMDKEVQKVCRHVETNYADPELSLDSICRDLMTGEAFLEALFEKELGMTVPEFIDQVRVNRAKIMIEKEPDVSPEDLAGAVGFKDPTELHRVFQRLTDTTLQEYRAASQHSSAGKRESGL